MADFSKTISNSVNAFGIAPSNKWNVFNWNAFTWGEGTSDLIVFIDHMLISEGFSVATDISLNFTVKNRNTFSIGTEISDLRLNDGTGVFQKVFPGNVTNATDRIETSYTKVS